MQTAVQPQQPGEKTSRAGSNPREMHVRATFLGLSFDPEMFHLPAKKRTKHSCARAQQTCVAERICRATATRVYLP